MIDTSTTEGKIEMQQAYIDGKRIIAESYINKSIIELKKEVEPTWSWNIVNYYIKPQTVEEAAKTYSSTPRANLRDQAAYDFKEGIKWRDENPKE